MSELMPDNNPNHNEIVSEILVPKKAFIQENKLIIIIVSAILVVALGVGGLVLTKSSPAQPYLDKICAAFNGLDVSKKSYNDNKALLDEQTINLDKAKLLDLNETSKVDAALSDFGSYVSQVSSTNFSIALAMTLGNLTELKTLTNQIDIDTETGTSAVAKMDAACGR